MVFLFLYIIVDIFTHLNDILSQHVAINTLLLYYLSYLPIIFVQVAPVTSLLSTLYTLGILNRNNELIAMRAAGLSIFQITKTVIFFGILVSIILFWVNDRFVPPALIFSQKVKMEMEKGSKKGEKKDLETINNLSMYGLKNRLFFVNKFSPAQKMMEGIIILEQDEYQDITKKIVANKGVYKEGLWTFYQCITYIFDKNSQILGEPQYFNEEIMTIPETPEEFLSQRQQPESMNITQLKDYIWKLSKSNATTVIRNMKVDLYQRFTMPLTVIISIMIGIPFSMMIRKRATGLSSLGISIMVGFIYYVLTAVSIALGKTGVFPPLLAASFPHILVLTGSICLIKSIP